METRTARMFEVEEATEISEDGPVEVSAPTVVLSAAPLMTVVESSAPTRREIPVARPPGTPMGAPRVARRAQAWTAPTVYETAPVGRIPMPGERPSETSSSVPVPGGRPYAVIGRIPMPGERPSADIVTVVHQLRRAVPAAAATAILPATRAGERRAAYVVGGDAMTRPRNVPPVQRESRGGLVLVGIIGLLAGLVVVLSVVVVRQQTQLREIRVPAQRTAVVCGAYADEVSAIAGELTASAASVTVVEHRIGERARAVVSDRELQRLCLPDTDPTQWSCPRGEAACLPDGVMQLRQALARR